ncbi:MAG: hypothetical protein WC022_04030 [Parcubacteria group bacterium]
MELHSPLGCMEAKNVIDFFFNNPPSREREKIFIQVLRHMVRSTPEKPHTVICQDCWDYYEGMKKIYCGG